MRTTWVVVLLAALGGAAVADDRAPVLDVEGAAGFVVPQNTFNSAPDGNANAPTPIGIARAMVSWERPPVPMPAEQGTATARFDIGPELGLGFLGNDRRGDVFAQAGLRLHLAFAQNSMGLLGISARGGIWLAARGGLVGGEHNAMMEGDLGWYIWLGDSGWRIGWEMGGFGVRNPVQAGMTMPLYSAQPDDVTAVVHFALFVGSEL